VKLPWVSRKRYEAEVRRLSTLVEKSLDPRLLGIEAHNGMLEIGLKGGAAQMLAAMFVQLLDERGAQNYVEVHFLDPKHGPIDVTVQRRYGKRPTDKLREAEDLLREALTMVDASLRDKINAVLP
jgi:hypothetical protein